MTREITIETTETIAFRPSPVNSAAWCSKCLRQTRFLSLESVSALLGVEIHELYLWMEEGKLHGEIAEQGRPTICAYSISRFRSLQLGRED